RRRRPARTPAARPTGRRPAMRLGLPDEVSDLFEACPAWMPDLTGGDRLPHAYADALRSMRRSPLDELAGADARPRQPPPITVTKRVNRPGAAAPRCRPDRRACDSLTGPAGVPTFRHLPTFRHPSEGSPRRPAAIRPT